MIVPGIHCPLVTYNFSSSRQISLAGPSTLQMSVLCLRMSFTRRTAIASNRDVLWDLLPIPTELFISVPCRDSSLCRSLADSLRHSRPYVRVGEHMVRHKWLFTSGCTVGLVIPISLRPKNARRHFVIRSSTWRELCRLSWNVTPKMSSFSFVSIGTEYKKSGWLSRECRLTNYYTLGLIYTEPESPSRCVICTAVNECLQTGHCST